MPAQRQSTDTTTINWQQHTANTRPQSPHLTPPRTAPQSSHSTEAALRKESAQTGLLERQRRCCVQAMRGHRGVHMALKPPTNSQQEMRVLAYTCRYAPPRPASPSRPATSVIALRHTTSRPSLQPSLAVLSATSVQQPHDSRWCVRGPKPPTGHTQPHHRSHIHSTAPLLHHAQRVQQSSPAQTGAHLGSHHTSCRRPVTRHHSHATPQLPVPQRSVLEAAASRPVYLVDEEAHESVPTHRQPNKALRHIWYTRRSTQQRIKTCAQAALPLLEPGCLHMHDSRRPLGNTWQPATSTDLT